MVSKNVGMGMHMRHNLTAICRFWGVGFFDEMIHRARNLENALSLPLVYSNVIDTVLVVAFQN